MKTLTLDQLRKHALTSGAELQIGGAKFNSDRARMADMPAPATPAPVLAPAAPQVPAAPPLTRADVDELLVARDAVWRQQIKQLTQAFGAALKAAQPQSAGTPSARVARFDITYDRDKCVTGIVPVYVH